MYQHQQPLDSEDYSGQIPDLNQQQLLYWSQKSQFYFNLLRWSLIVVLTITGAFVIIGLTWNVLLVIFWLVICFFAFVAFSWWFAQRAHNRIVTASFPPQTTMPPQSISPETDPIIIDIPAQRLTR